MAISRPARVALGLLVATSLGVVGAVVASNLLLEAPVVEGCEATANGRTTKIGIPESENASLIAALSVQRGMPPRAASIALATAYQESGLRNLTFGHLDSVGLFQQRPSQGWGTEEQILDPYYSATRFYESLAKVRGYSTMDIAEAAQRVQRSADGGAYAQHETNARTLASVFTGHSPAGFTCNVRDLTTPPAPDDLRAELDAAFGGLDVESGGDEETARVDVRAGAGQTDAALGWAVAHWGVAHAKRFGIGSVSYARQAWSADRSKDGWRPAEEPAPRTVVRFLLPTAPPE